MAAPSLMADLIEEILLRLPPDEPACLVHASLVSKLWRHILSDPAFPRRYRAFHRTPPLLGYICNDDHHYDSSEVARFVPVSTAASPISPSEVNDYWALDCRHGRVLLHTSLIRTSLIVWNPINGKQQHLNTPYAYTIYECAAAVLCALDSCDHLNCSGGPFYVVFFWTRVVAEGVLASASIYSWETGTWGASTASIFIDYFIDKKPGILVGDALYFTVQYGKSILKYDMKGRALSVIESPCASGVIILTAAEEEGGGLGFVAVSDSSIRMWSRHAGTAEGTARWVHRWAMELDSMFPRFPWLSSLQVIGLVEIPDTLLINSRNLGIFTLGLKSRQVRKVGNRVQKYSILPHMGFYIPAGGLFSFG